MSESTERVCFQRSIRTSPSPITVHPACELKKSLTVNPTEAALDRVGRRNGGVRASLSLRLKDPLGPVTRVKKKGGLRTEHTSPATLQYCSSANWRMVPNVCEGEVNQCERPQCFSHELASLRTDGCRATPTLEVTQGQILSQSPTDATSSR